MNVRVVKSPDSRTKADQRMLKTIKPLTIINVKVQSIKSKHMLTGSSDKKHCTVNFQNVGQQNIVPSSALKTSESLPSDKNLTIISSSCKADLKDSLQKASTFMKSSETLNPKLNLNSNISTQRNIEYSKETNSDVREINKTSQAALDKYRNSVSHKTYINNFSKSPTNLSDLLLSHDQKECNTNMINLKKSPVSIVSVRRCFNQRENISNVACNLKTIKIPASTSKLGGTPISELKEKLSDLGDRMKRIISLYKNRLNTIN